MKILFVAGGMLLFAFQFLFQAYAMELCEAQDYYNLANAAKCPVKYNKSDPRESMFEIMNNYPFENRDAFVKLFQRKIALVDSYIKKLQGQMQTESVKAGISKLEQTKQVISDQVGIINSATRDNWAGVRDQARKVLKDASSSLREVD